MHESCYDFDLCENCEALPISVHPINHPLLKMRVPSAVVPTVLRSNQTSAPPMHVPLFASPVPVEPGRIPSSNPSDNELHYPGLIPDISGSSLRAMTPHRLPSPDTNFTYPHSPLDPFHWTSGDNVRYSMLPDSPPPRLEPSTFAPELVLSPDAVFMPPLDPPSPRFQVEHLLSHPYGSPSPSPPIQQTASPECDAVLQSHPSVDPPMFESVPQLVDIGDPVQVSTFLPALEENPEATLAGVSTPSDAPPSSSSKSVPRLGLANGEWPELWPEFTSVFKHLLQPPSPPPALAPGPSSVTIAGVEAPKTTEDQRRAVINVEAPSAIEESPLVGEPLLCRPLMPEHPQEPVVKRNLSDLIGNPVRPITAIVPTESDDNDSLPSLATVPSSPVVQSERQLSPLSITTLWQPATRPSLAFTAEFLSDSNIPAGQIFPPGAEFVKLWKMRNDGIVDWPETTELVFVAGDRMAPHVGAPISVRIGAVKAGAEVELVSSEMKVRGLP